MEENYLTPKEEKELSRQAFWLIPGLVFVALSVKLFDWNEGFFGMIAFVVSAAFFQEMRKSSEIKDNHLLQVIFEEAILIGILIVAVEILDKTTRIFK